MQLFWIELYYHQGWGFLQDLRTLLSVLTDINQKNGPHWKNETVLNEYMER